MRSRSRTAATLTSGALGAVLVAALLAVPAAQASPTPADQPQPLRSARPVFWDGARDVDAALSGGREQFLQGWTYPLEVREASDRLRLGLDVAVEGIREWADGRTNGAVGSRFRLELLRGGEVVSSTSMMTGYSRELFAKVLPGMYAVRVRPVDDADYTAATMRRQRGTATLSFRLRAALESAPAEVDDGPLLPNLRIIAPFEIGFPAGTVTYGPGVSAPQGTVPTCMGEEYEEEVSEAVFGVGAQEQPDPQPAVRCLRFSAGIENVGDGPLVIAQPDWPDDPDHPGWWTRTKNADFPAYQRILTVKDGRTSYVDEELGSAGSTRWHPSHGHFHFENAYGYVLSRLGASPLAPVQEVGPAQKRGFNPGDEKISRWTSFDQCPMTARAPSDTTGGCRYGWSDGIAVLGVGWGDVYEWNRSGQYASFPVDAAGRPVPGDYLLVGTADPDQVVWETDETDNASYAVFTVTADRVVLRERGYGNGPRDPHRRVVRTAP